MLNLNPSKDQIRKKMLLKRQLLVPAKVKVFSAVICHKLTWLSLFKRAKKVLLYMPVKNEVETSFIASLPAMNKKDLFLPAYDGKSWLVCEFNCEDKLQDGPFKIPQPARLKRLKAGQLDLAILPGLAFSQSGIRIGYGKGVYDALLANTKCTKIGFCFDFQIIDNIKAQDHDILMDIIISEKRIMATH